MTWWRQQVGRGDLALLNVEHGAGRPVVVLHGAGVDHRESEACFESALRAAGRRRIYPDLPGMGRSTVPETISSADDVVTALLDDAGHALPHEQPELLRALFDEWLVRVERRFDRRA